MPLPQSHIHWPAVIHYDNDAELECVESVDHWMQQQDWLNGHFEKKDVLIDSDGLTYSLQADENKQVFPSPNGGELSLVKVLGLVKAHLADQGSCCVAKTYAPTIRDAILMVINSGEKKQI